MRLCEASVYCAGLVCVLYWFLYWLVRISKGDSCCRWLLLHVFRRSFGESLEQGVHFQAVVVSWLQTSWLQMELLLWAILHIL